MEMHIKAGDFWSVTPCCRLENYSIMKKGAEYSSEKFVNSTQHSNLTAQH